MSCSSYIKVSDYVFEWKFSCNRRPKKGGFDRSEIFYAGAEHESTWYMKFYPMGIDYASEGFVSWGLSMINGENVKISGEVILKYDNGMMIAEDRFCYTFADSSDEYTIANFVKREKIPYSRMTISCELKITEKNILPYVRRIKDFNCVISDIHSLLSDQKDTDVSLVSQDQREFRAHKTVLAARSEVFAAMFQNECEESVKGKIEISDMTGSDIEEMLQYIYSGNFSKWSCLLCMSLYEAGDKYKINGLKEACSQYLQANLTVNISVKSFILSDMHSDKAFKKAVIDYMVKNVKAVLNTPDWKTLGQEKPYLVDELILAISGC